MRTHRFLPPFFDCLSFSGPGTLGPMKLLIMPALALWAPTVVSFAAVEPGHLQEQIDRASPRSEVIVPKGTWTQPLTINKALKLRGESASDSILAVTSDQPALL